MSNGGDVKMRGSELNREERFNMIRRKLEQGLTGGVTVSNWLNLYDRNICSKLLRYTVHKHYSSSLSCVFSFNHSIYSIDIEEG